eukprot:TRINITY_DN37273_c0_g1_i8.p1 TRINITY_DN37273_c0_g1~~TRINITY_DN37273_c0_g1_i8.p1  ORF type:complete len:305 (+),score=11.36 TRINITY_DN37273_c0_g1_i8:101-1015(+)
MYMELAPVEEESEDTIKPQVAPRHKSSQTLPAINFKVSEEKKRSSAQTFNPFRGSTMASPGSLASSLSVLRSSTAATPAKSSSRSPHPSPKSLVPRHLHSQSSPMPIVNPSELKDFRESMDVDLESYRRSIPLRGRYALVTDRPSSGRACCALMNAWGVICVLASSYEQCLETLSLGKYTFDYVFILDSLLPEKFKIPRVSHAKHILVSWSHSTDKAFQTKAFVGGFEYVLSKPIKRTTLLRSLLEPWKPLGEVSSPVKPSRKEQQQQQQQQQRQQRQQFPFTSQIGRAVQQECRDRSRMPSSA